MIREEIRKLPLSYLRTVHQYLEKVRQRRQGDVVILADVPRDRVGEDIVVATPRSSKQQVLTFAVSLPRRPRRSEQSPAEILNERFATIRNRLLSEGFSTPDAARELSLSPEGIRQKAARRELLALKLGRDYRFPRWQFKGDAPDGIIPGLRDVLAASVLPPLELAVWFESKMAALDDRTPIEAIESGDLDDVVAAAEAAGVS
jgi:hypothetical protein